MDFNLTEEKMTKGQTLYELHARIKNKVDEGNDGPK